MDAKRLGDTSRRCELSFNIVLALSFNVDKSSDIDSPGMIEKVSAMIVVKNRVGSKLWVLLNVRGRERRNCQSDDTYSKELMGRVRKEIGRRFNKAVVQCRCAMHGKTSHQTPSLSSTAC